MERVCDEKSGERRGDQLKMATELIACFRKIFAAQIPPSPQRDQGRTAIFRPKPQRNQGRKGILKSQRSTVTHYKQASSAQAKPSQRSYTIRLKRTALDLTPFALPWPEQVGGAPSA
jgi:hypothetical protein